MIRSSNDDDVHKVKFILRQLNIISGPPHQATILCLKCVIKSAKAEEKTYIFSLVLSKVVSLQVLLVWLPVLSTKDFNTGGSRISLTSNLLWTGFI